MQSSYREAGRGWLPRANPTGTSVHREIAKGPEKTWSGRKASATERAVLQC